MPENNLKRGVMAGFLAAMAMIGFLLVFVYLGFRAVPEANHDFFNTCLIALISCVSTTFGYYLGSSDGSARKNEMLATGGTAPPETRPDTGGFIVPRLLPQLALAGLLGLILTGCSGFQQKTPGGQATQTLLSTQTAVIGMAEAADRMCSQGTLNQRQCDQVATIYLQAQAAYDLAATLLTAAIETDTPAAWQNYRLSHDRFIALYTEMNAAAVQFNLLPTMEKGGAR